MDTPEAESQEEMADAQMAQVKRDLRERLQEESETVSKVVSVPRNRGKESTEFIKPASVYENVQIAKLESKIQQKTLHEESGKGSACVHSKRANLRSGPGKKYQKLRQVKIYTPLERVRRDGPWVQVKDFKGEMFWVYETLITENYLCGMVIQDKADFYSRPDFNSLPFYGAPMETGFSVRILSTDFQNDWAKVADSAGNILWVQKSMLWIR
mgnify:FL=1